MGLGDAIKERPEYTDLIGPLHMDVGSQFVSTSGYGKDGLIDMEESRCGFQNWTTAKWSPGGCNNFRFILFYRNLKDEWH